MTATIIDDPAILNLLIAPGGVVSDIYPLEGNEAVLGLDFLSEGAGISVTISLGIAPASPVNEVEAAITQADNALYKAKKEGRNRSVFYEGGCSSQ